MAAEVRVPQQARSHATRARLVEAAAAMLVAHGYAGASTAVVAQAAGVSQGALFKHFPSKAQLLGACVAEILARFFETFREDAGARLLAIRPRTVEERIPPAIAALWSIFRSPELRAVFEVYVAARTEPALEVELAPILASHRLRIQAEARALFPELASHPDFEGAIDAIVYAMQGVAVGVFGPEARDDAKNLAFFERLAFRELEHVRDQLGDEGGEHPRAEGGWRR